MASPQKCALTVTAIRTSQEKTHQTASGLPTASSIQPRMRGDGRFHPLWKDAVDLRTAVRASTTDLPGESKDVYHLMDTVEWTYSCAGCQVLPLIRRGKASSGKENGTNWVEKKKWHESTMFNKQLFLVVEGAPFPRIPVTGRNHSYTGVHTYTSQGVCVCDSYTVIILDG